MDLWRRGGVPGLSPFQEYVVHGLDEYLEYVQGYRRSTFNQGLYFYLDAADSCYGAGVIATTVAVRDAIIARGLSVVYEDTGKDLERLITGTLPLFLPRYSLSLVLVHNLPEVGVCRAMQRFHSTGRYAPDDYVRGSYVNVEDNFWKLAPLAIQALYCDNSCGGREPEAGAWRNCMTCRAVSV
jgi:hypothetical protein